MTTDADAASLGVLFLGQIWDPPTQACQAFLQDTRPRGKRWQCSANVYITPSHDTEIDLGTDC